MVSSEFKTICNAGEADIYTAIETLMKSIMSMTVVNERGRYNRYKKCTGRNKQQSFLRNILIFKLITFFKFEALKWIKCQIFGDRLKTLIIVDLAEGKTKEIAKIIISSNLTKIGISLQKILENSDVGFLRSRWELYLINLCFISREQLLK